MPLKFGGTPSNAENGHYMNLLRLVTISGFVVMGVWAISVLDAIFTHDYQPMQVVTPVMVIYAGFIFAATRKVK